MIKLVLGFLLLVAACSAAKKRSQYRIFKNMTSVGGKYDKSEPPSSAPDDPTIVKIGYYIEDLKVDSQKQEMVLDLTLRQSWYDERLRFDDEKDVIAFGSRETKDIWLPGTFFKHAVEKKAADDSNVILKIYKDGKVTMAEKITLRLKCKMNLQKFPFDTQKCPLSIESFKYKMDSVILKFFEDRNPIALIDESVEIGNFVLKGDPQLLDCSTNFTEGSYSCLEVGFVLKRDHGSFSKHKFFPAAILLLFLYTSTWMGNQILLPRTLILIVSSVLLCANIAVSSVILEHPVVGYLTADDLWYSIVVILLMVAIIEFCVVARLCNKTDGIPEESGSRCLKCGNVIDWIFRIVFLILIILFLCGYFVLYTVI